MASMPRKAVSLVVVLAVFGIIASIGIPIAVDALNTNSSVTLNTSVDETDEVNPNLNTTLDSVTTTAPESATYTLQTASGASESNTIEAGSNATYSFGAGDVVVTVDEVGADYAVASYEYPRDMGFSGSTAALWAMLGLMLVLAAFLYAVYVALDGADMT